MPDKIVLDSCIIAAVFLPEAITGKAIEAAADNECITVDLAYTEVANAAWKRVMHAGDDPASIRSCLDDSIAFIRETCEVVPARELMAPAWDIACLHRITIYDALFVAASIRCNAPLVTADKKLADAVRKPCRVIRVD
jgi:predicted nucleic acid-binding protein